MLDRSHRFHGYGSLRATYQRGQTLRGQALSLRFSVRNNNKPYRVAVVVSKQVSKSAVTRNRIRRRIYEAVRTNADLVPANSDLIFTAFSDQLAEAKPEKLQKTVAELLHKTSTPKS
ncbi:MAG TPA: ribonuclease P protein component [Candidatus Saccharimonadales bacterium]|nr:ribonuclease P protein component [Candidatus Saccharimonadales bacterium]